jgi:hypothetical protein
MLSRATLEACWPWLALLLVLVAAAWGLARMSRARLRLARLGTLHADQAGSAQSLSFVLTLPLFIMVLMMIVQVSQLMIGAIVVQYAAFAAARSAAVWIPADLPDPEGPNCISSYAVDPTAPDQSPVTDPTAAGYGPAAGGVTYLLAADSGSPKYQKITSAAVLACVPISPSRNVGSPAADDSLLDTLQSAYAALAPSGGSSEAISGRLQNKLAYATANTQIQGRFYHKNAEPPLMTYDIPDGLPDGLGVSEFASNELGWQDQITVTVNYNLALLPGPGRLLAHYVAPGGTPDPFSQAIQQQGSTYVYPLTASVSIGNEGEKSVVAYAYSNP